MTGWKVGDKIGPVSQTQNPRVLLRWGKVAEIHDNGLTVQWPGEKQLRRYHYAYDGIKMERRPSTQCLKQPLELLE